MQPPRGYRGCDEFVAKDRAKCIVAAQAARRLRDPTSAMTKWGRFRQWRDLRLLRRAPRRYAVALRRWSRWDNWAYRTMYSRMLVGGTCSSIPPMHRAECEERKAREKAYWAARDARDPEVQMFQRYARQQRAY